MYYALRKKYDGGKLQEMKLKRYTDEEFERAYSDENVKFFRGFGKCRKEYVNGRGWHWVSHCYNEKFEEWTYTTLGRLIAYEGLEEIPLKPIGGQASFYGKAQILMSNPKSGAQKELGLRSYDELVAVLDVGVGILVEDWFSATTCKHINSYVFRPNINYYSAEYPLKKADIKGGKMCYFKQ